MHHDLEEIRKTLAKHKRQILEIQARLGVHNFYLLSTIALSCVVNIIVLLCNW